MGHSLGGGQPQGLPSYIRQSLTARAYIEGVNAGAWPPFRHRLWQRNYYEHILRHDESLAELRQYILYNPARWAFDRENPRVLR